jgi:hypothetical protein
VTIARITTPGLAAMGLSVALLWGCLIGEQVLVRQATLERAQALHDIELLRRRQRSEPVSLPRLPLHPGVAARG